MFILLSNKLKSTTNLSILEIAKEDDKTFITVEDMTICLPNKDSKERFIKLLQD